MIIPNSKILETREEEDRARTRRKMILDQVDDEDDVQAEYREEGGEIIEGIYIPPKLVREEPKTSGERLVIEKIVCENFKSYGGFKEMGPFHKSFSAIVGPNGNGKSNIIDAMLFVFGYRASKIRCKKVSVLIHKSELLPSLNSCAVTVHFVKILDDGQEDMDGLKIIPNSRITVKRKAYLNNSSAYWLDGKSVKFQDVAAFLKRNGIDIVHNRFLILQGEVESIAQMPPKSHNGLETGLLEFLEEVTGTVRYNRCLAQLEEKIEQLDELRDEHLQRVSFVEAEKCALEEPLKKAKEYLRDLNFQTRTEHAIVQVKAYNLKLRKEELKASTIELEEERRGVLERLQEVVNINKARREEYDKFNKAYAKAKSQFDKTQKEYESLEKKFTQVNADLSRDNESRKKSKKELEASQVDYEKIKEVPDEKQRELEKLQKRRDELTVEVTEEHNRIEGNLAELDKQIKSCIKERDMIQKEFAALKRNRDKNKMQLDRAERDLEHYKSQAEIEKNKLIELENALKELNAALQRKEKEGRKSLGSTELNTISETFKVKQQELRRLIDVEKQKEAIQDRLRTEHDELKQTAIDGQAGDQTYKMFLKAKSEGTLTGFRGKVKDLATIPEKYNVGATMATGMLENWVVDDDATGSKCIEMLKNAGIGAQTFLCLAKMRSYAERSRRRFQAPPNTHRIFDLLEFEQDLAPVYYKAFNDTLIADNIDIATKVAYGPQRYRVATCAGQVIETTGSMAGGGNQTPRGSFNSDMSKRLKTSVVTPQQLEKAKHAYDRALQELESAREARNTVESELRELKKREDDLRQRQLHFESDLATSRKQVTMKQAQLKDQEKIVADSVIVPQVLKEKEKAVAAAQSVVESERKQFEAAEANLQESQSKVHDLQENKRKKLMATYNRLNQMFDTVKKEIDKVTSDIKNHLKTKSKLEAHVKKMEKQIHEIEERMRKTVEDKKRMEQTGKELKEQLDAQNEGVETSKKELEQVAGNVGEFEKEEKDLYKNKVKIEGSIKAAKDELAPMDNRLTGYTKKLDDLKLQDIPDEITNPFEVFNDEAIAKMEMKNLDHTLNKIAKKLQGQKPNLLVIDQYKVAVVKFLEKVKELDGVSRKRDEIRSVYLRTTAQRLQEFLEGFVIISTRLKEMFRMISMGGDAELDLIDSTDPFSSGINFNVRPARKTWKQITNLSGGEKTLSSLSLVFALHYYKPSPFYVMDEIDAALDFKNVSIIANYIKDRTKFTQFIIISLRSNMFELADSLLGVYKIDNMSYSMHIGISRLMRILQKRAQLLQDNEREKDKENRNDATLTIVPPKPSPHDLIQNNISSIEEPSEGSQPPGSTQNCIVIEIDSRIPSPESLNGVALVASALDAYSSQGSATNNNHDGSSEDMFDSLEANERDDEEDEVMSIGSAVTEDATTEDEFSSSD